MHMFTIISALNFDFSSGIKEFDVFLISYKPENPVSIFGFPKKWLTAKSGSIDYPRF